MRKYNSKLFSLFCIVFLQIDTFIISPVSRSEDISSIFQGEVTNKDIRLGFRSNSSSQKLADKPNDRPIRVKAHNHEYCYIPTFRDDEGYVYIDDCSFPGVQDARYDVFQRIGWKINDIWLCMTAPSSVTGIDGSSTKNWDYILLRPCVTNDANQRWIIQDGAFYTADRRFRVKNYTWYTYISKNLEDYYDHTLTAAMDKWVKTVATPVNMSLKISVGWKYAGRFGLMMYYISDNGSTTDVFHLYYNPENGHLARYLPSSGVLFCMMSQQSSFDDWNWVHWTLCKDTVTGQKDIGYWDLSILNGSEGPILDYQGNFLRVTQYGPNWGVPYTAKPNYLHEDTRNLPISEFILPYDMQRWSRYVHGNLGETLAYCPASGTKSNDDASPRIGVKQSSPLDFQLTENWRRRFYAISTTTDNPSIAVGICETCLLHAYQMVAELQEYYPRRPLLRGGYFFDTALHTNPFISLYQRYPLIGNIMRTILSFYGIPLRLEETKDVTFLRLAAAATQSILPHFNWSVSNIALGHDDIISAIRLLLEAPVGTVWLGFMTYLYPNEKISVHAVPILRSEHGLIVIPTNTSMDWASFAEEVSETTDLKAVLLRLAQRKQVTVRTLATLQLTGKDRESLSAVMSQNNCMGDGEYRRGSREFPRSSTVNQCDSGRCPL